VNVLSVSEVESFAIAGKRMVVGGDMLKVQFEFSYDKASYLAATILAMNEMLRGKGKLLKMSVGGTDYYLASNDHPEINAAGNILYLKGRNKEMDNESAIRIFKSHEVRNKALSSFCSLIEKINNVKTIGTTIKNEDGINELAIEGEELSVLFSYEDKSCTLAAKILSQNEELRGKGTILDNGPYRIYSNDSPEINDKTLFIRGLRTNSTKDNAFVSYLYSSTENRDKALNEFVKLITKINYPWMELKE
jgi:hypothetical protein